MTRRTLSLSLLQEPADRVDLVIVGGRWVAIYTGPHAFTIMEHSPDGSCCLETPYPADRAPDEVIAWQRTQTPAPMVITAEGNTP